MKIIQPKHRGGMWGAQFEARDFPKCELIEPKLAKLGFELDGDYVGTSANPFLIEALTVSPEVVLHALALSHFEFERPVSLAGSIEAAAWGARFGFKNLNQWNSFHRIITGALAALPELSQTTYAAYLYSLVNEGRGANLQIAGVVMSLNGSGKSPILSRVQIEAFMRVRTYFGDRIDPKLVARLITNFTLVEALEMFEAKLTSGQMNEVLEIRCDFHYEASVSELIAMRGGVQHRWLRELMA